MDSYDERTPSIAYALALAELCSRIWQELESLASLLAGSEIFEARTELSLTAATLRLELLVIVDACGSARWRSMLPLERRRHLCKVLADVLETIAVGADGLTRSMLERAQDRLLDEVIAQSSFTSCVDAVSAALGSNTRQFAECHGAARQKPIDETAEQHLGVTDGRPHGRSCGSPQI